MSNHLESWVWKAEPVSPSGASVGEADDDWLYTDDKSTSPNTSAGEPELYDEHPSRAQVATKLLEELDEWIKEGNIPSIDIIFFNFLFYRSK